MAVTRTIPAGDLALEGGTFVELGRTDETRVRYIRQVLATRFKFFLGEWFLDQRQGAPFYRDVFVKNPNMDLIRSLFLRICRTTPGVLDVVDFSLSFNPSARRLTFSFQALVEGGEFTVRPEDEDFLVDVATAA